MLRTGERLVQPGSIAAVGGHWVADVYPEVECSTVEGKAQGATLKARPALKALQTDPGDGPGHGGFCVLWHEVHGGQWKVTVMGQKLLLKEHELEAGQSRQGRRGPDNRWRKDHR